MKRPSKRRLRAINERVDRELDSDRNFFVQFPHRQFRVRRMYPHEREQFELVGGSPLGPLPPDVAWFVAVEKVRPDVRLRAPFIAEGDTDADLLDEDVCRATFHRHENEFLDSRTRPDHGRGGIEMKIRPKTFNGDLSRLPAAIEEWTDQRIWAPWRWELKRGRWSKPPLLASDLSRHAEVNNPGFVVALQEGARRCRSRQGGWPWAHAARH